MKKNKLPKVAIVGAPNVGKSSIFNRIVGARTAIVERSSGTTRDRIYANIKWKGRSFIIIDTAGFEASGGGDMAALVLKQLRKGIEEADIILFVTDGSIGIMPQDRELSSIVRKTSKKTYLVVNKIDKESDAGKALDFFELGMGEPYTVSAMHDRGIDKLCNDLVKNMGNPSAASSAETVYPVRNEIFDGVKVAIIGRPNVGKSSYLNAILSEERVIVHPTAGTTRDAIDTDFDYKGRDYVLIDTAGIRHNPKTSEAADFYGGIRSIEAIKRSDVAIMLIDGYEGMTKDDARIIDLVITEGKALVIAVNKWDLVKEIEMSKYSDRLIREMNIIRNYPIIYISCKTKRNIDPSLDMIWSVCEKSRMTVKPDKLAEILKSLNSAPQISSKRIKFKFLVQEDAMPLKFILGLKGADLLNDNLKRYIENFFRSACDLEGIPVRIRFENTSKK